MIRDLNSINQIIIHHTASNASIQSINAGHKARLHPSANKYGYHIAYHYIIEKNGNIIKTRPIKEVGYHAGVWDVNLKSIGVSLMGNFEYEIPTTEQLETLHNILFDIVHNFGLSIKEIKGHRDVKATACPGKNLYAFLPELKEKSFETDEILFNSQLWLDIENQNMSPNAIQEKLAERNKYLRKK